MFLFFGILANLQDVKLAESPGKLQRFLIALPSNRDECYEDDLFFTQLKYWFDLLFF